MSRLESSECAFTRFGAKVEGIDVAFEEIYCIAFEALDAKWLEMRASYMDFPAVMK